MRADNPRIKRNNLTYITVGLNNNMKIRMDKYCDDNDIRYTDFVREAIREKLDKVDRRKNAR